MLKIVPVENTSGAPVLVLEGVVIGQWVEELRRSCELLLAESRAPILDLAGVSFVGRDGIELLRRLQGSHVVLSNCSRFVSEQLKAR